MDLLKEYLQCIKYGDDGITSKLFKVKPTTDSFLFVVNDAFKIL